MAEEPQKVRGVYQHPPGSGVWWIHYHDHGRRHRERVGTRANAIKLYQKRKTQIFEGAKLPELQRKRLTFGELIDDAVAYAKEHHKSPRDIEGKAALVKPDLGHLAAESITTAELDGWIRRRKVSPATQNRYKAFFSLCFREGIHNKKAAANPAKLVRRKREPEGRKRFLTREEFEVLLSQVTSEKHPHRRRTVIVSVLSGMRLGEQFSLDWTQVDFSRGEINLTDTKNGSDRTIPMVRAVREVLEEQWKETGKGKKRGSLVFARPLRGKGAVQLQWFEKAVADAELDNYTWHNNRHTFCSWLAIANVPLKTIQELAGHKTIAMTARYAHLCPDHKRSEMERMAEQPKAGIVVPFARAIKTANG